MKHNLKAYESLREQGKETGRLEEKLKLNYMARTDKCIQRKQNESTLYRHQNKQCFHCLCAMSPTPVLCQIQEHTKTCTKYTCSTVPNYIHLEAAQTQTELKACGLFWQRSSVHSRYTAYLSADYPTNCGQCGCLKKQHSTGGMTSVQHSLIHKCISRGTDEYLSQTHKATAPPPGKLGGERARQHHPLNKTVGPLYITSEYSRSTASLFQKSALLIIHTAPSIFQS